MQFSCAIFLAAVIGIAGAILASLSLLFWQARSPRNLQPDETQKAIGKRFLSATPRSFFAGISRNL
jgi:hypothetical protein